MAKATKAVKSTKKSKKDQPISQFADTTGASGMLEPAPGAENIKAGLKEKVTADVSAKLADNIAPVLADNIQPVVEDSVDQAVDEYYDDSKVQEVTETAKNILSSVTLWGVMISATSRFLAFMGYEFGDDSVQGDLINYLAIYAPVVAGFVGDGIAFRGRLRARHQLVFRRVKK